MSAAWRGLVVVLVIKRGRTVNAARKIAMLVCAVGVIRLCLHTGWKARGPPYFLIGLAAACHQGFSANLYTLTSDMFPGSCGGLGGGHRRYGRRRSGDCLSLPLWATCFNGLGVTGCLS